jgi:hypothetical protein
MITVRVRLALVWKVLLSWPRPILLYNDGITYLNLHHPQALEIVNDPLLSLLGRFASQSHALDY